MIKVQSSQCWPNQYVDSQWIFERILIFRTDFMILKKTQFCNYKLRSQKLHCLLNRRIFPQWFVRTLLYSRNWFPNTFKSPNMYFKLKGWSWNFWKNRPLDPQFFTINFHGKNQFPAIWIPIWMISRSNVNVGQTPIEVLSVPKNRSTYFKTLFQACC